MSDTCVSQRLEMSFTQCILATRRDQQRVTVVSVPCGIRSLPSIFLILISRYCMMINTMMTMTNYGSDFMAMSDTCINSHATFILFCLLEWSPERSSQRSHMQDTELYYKGTIWLGRLDETEYLLLSSLHGSSRGSTEYFNASVYRSMALLELNNLSSHA